MLPTRDKTVGQLMSLRAGAVGHPAVGIIIRKELTADEAGCYNRASSKHEHGTFRHVIPVRLSFSPCWPRTNWAFRSRSWIACFGCINRAA
jgi:hypothetical protein